MPLSGFRVALPFVDCWQLARVVTAHSNTNNDIFSWQFSLPELGRLGFHQRHPVQHRTTVAIKAILLVEIESIRLHLRTVYF